MPDVNIEKNKRILIIDDNTDIHNDFRAILCPEKNDTSTLEKTKAALFGQESIPEKESFELDSAFQGQEGLEKVIQAQSDGKPYAMTFVDVRMPPGWDGIETIKRIWQVQPELQVILCTAYSDYSWQEMTKQLEQTDRLLILKKPFDNMEVYQLACALTEKWMLAQQAKLKQKDLERLVEQRTKQLAVTLKEAEKTNEALHRSEQKYRSIFENSAVAITMFDKNEKLISWNKFTELLLAMDEKDLFLKPAQSFYPEKEWKKIKAQNIREKGMQHQLETKMIKGNGQIIDVDISLSVLQNFKGQITGSLGIIRDITERKKLHEILQLKRKNLEAIFDAVPVGMLLLDQNMIVRRVNHAIRKIVQKEYHNIINRKLGNALGCQNSSDSCGKSKLCEKCSLQNIIKKVLESNKPVHNAEVRPVLNIQGTPINPWLRISAQPTSLNDKTYIVLAIDDITEQKKTEEKLRETMEMKSQLVSTSS
ncbi:MAG: PAS domain S-box protein [Sedimentisphaerales bacterium]|nr:PAS domain S-box protein [Sedimentisphaerales bacterium]